MRVLLLGRVGGTARLCLKTRRALSSKVEHTFMSFFLFEDLKSPVKVADTLRATLREESFRGTIYVAPEGINGQFSIPTKKISSFQSIIAEAHSSFSAIRFNVGDTYMEGDGREDIITFKRLSVKVREYILTDGLRNHNINWKDYGPALPAREWHKEIDALSSDNPDTRTVLLDCRNDYESNIGNFKNSIPVNTSVFSETFDALQLLLRDVPKDVRVLTYCTGGIRCVKVNAYLSQHLGYTNTATLKDGIVGYKKWLSDEKVDEENSVASVFRGDNYVFDRRRVQHMTVSSGDNMTHAESGHHSGDGSTL